MNRTSSTTHAQLTSRTLERCN